ncbi:type IV toxin-antitoxin system AbiEi family antitoxin [Leptospira bandrabouensis]|uniref:type IV toxin-antitoxin system AbiEi family antitoxin n=1 Tax=Leptospira bandrabouensis TaxID=2484903 RepID=UPI001EE78C1C|nr:type IV toxin-antitoxin system AbiEi family antitoxin [Leptospira bandrabouensis]MCG6146512.1 type IV toxin-antitoxin system AbiEi family antitoxin [Leptospira bandrabouensis]MCG6161884.1 type IV toxin-antitoxin system AbiEi family antitoxin [Leptospira bandrabouensis]MCG6166065.1 type IV toxin-antitoxin system AbiEi family antitoxin [Leptospira bandrabouensis]
MNTMKNGTKIRNLFTGWVPGGVYSSRWLREQGYSYSNLQVYRRSGWLQALGSGAYTRSGDDLQWQGGVWGLQTQLNLPIHVGGKTAIEEAGYAQYLNLGKQKVYLIADPDTKLPTWFRKTNWNAQIEFSESNLFSQFSYSNQKQDQSLKTVSFGKLDILYSTPERAILEYLDWVPEKHSFQEAHEIMENLTSLRPKLMQGLLERCHSIKAKRLFCAIANKINHPWFLKLEIDKIDLGSGNRQLVSGGEYDSKYKITVMDRNE